MASPQESANKEVKMKFDVVRIKKNAARSKIISALITVLISGLLVSIPIPANAAACVPTSTTVSGETVLTFTTVGSCDWEVPVGVTSVRVLVVGGGGSGSGGISGAWFSAGGGGGAVVENQSLTVTPGAAISVTVGRGGAKSIYNTTYTGADFDLRSGAASVFGSVTAGGGKTPINSTTPVGGVSGNGNAGGIASPVVYAWGYGGAGAGAAGSAENPGAGVTSNISGTSLEYGGGGNSFNSGSTGLARDGAGSNGAAAADNRGGGGAQMPKDGYNGGAGGSGVVIVRYAVTCVPTEITASNGDKIVTFSTTGTCSWKVPSGVSKVLTPSVVTNR